MTQAFPPAEFTSTEFGPPEFAGTDVTIDDCWKRIGIHGDKSCPELSRHVHCRNCPAYSLAAAKLLDRDLPGRVETGHLDKMAAAVPGEQADTESVLIFRVGAEWFALSTLVLDEIIGLLPIHSLPHHRNPGLLGLVNVRGELVVCVCIAQLLVGTPASAPQGRLIVARHSGGRLAFPVDEVQHTHHHCPGDLKPVPATVARSVSNFAKGLLPWRDKIVGCLDERLVFDALNRGLA